MDNIEKLSLSIIAIFIGFGLSAQTSTTSSGSWGAGSNWSLGTPGNNIVATINHAMNLDANISLKNGGKYVINSPVTDTLGGTEYSLNIEGSSHFDANANITIGGDLYMTTNGTLTIRSYDTLYVRGNAELRVNSRMTIETNGVLIIDGNFTLSQNNANTINGKVFVKGNISAKNSAFIDGTGNVEAIGDVDLKGKTSLFGNGSGCKNGCEYGSGAGLPIELEYFQAEMEDNKLYFQWETLSELNNHYFEVEYSAGGDNFTPILRVEGAGNSNQTINYQKNIIAPNTAAGYYRLKQTDYDGKFSYSEVEYINQVLVSNREVNVYPNPTDGQRLFVELINFKPTQYTVDILDNRGQLVKSKKIQIESESIYFELELLHGSQLNRGVYYLRISSVDERFLEKVLVE